VCWRAPWFWRTGAAFAQQYGDRQYDRRDDPAMQQSSRGERGARYLPPERDPRYDVRAYEEQRRRSSSTRSSARTRARAAAAAPAAA
jgi:hypothetical protein